MEPYFDIAFTPSVRRVQEHKGAREHYAKLAAGWGPPDSLTEDEIAHIRARDRLYLATVSETGWPYVQHRGGDVGFVKVIDPSTIGWVERKGNRQYVGTGNITASERVALVLVDYPNRTRLKIYGNAVYDRDPSPELLQQLDATTIRHDGAVTIHIVATDWNCPKHITPRFTADEVRAMTAPLRERIEALERQVEGR